MRYLDLKTHLQKLVTFSLQDLYLVDPNFRQATLYDWEKAEKVIKLRNNCYIFADFKPTDSDYYLLSNQIYQPSYISLELALNHYSIIPELVANITAISTNKTQSFSTPVGIFQYQSIRADLFFGYDLIEHRGYGIQIASLEKTVLDYLYLHTEIDSTIYFETLRWNKQELQQQISNNKLYSYLKIFDNKALESRVKLLDQYLK